jgi:hypothetical protein
VNGSTYRDLRRAAATATAEPLGLANFHSSGLPESASLGVHPPHVSVTCRQGLAQMLVSFSAGPTVAGELTARYQFSEHTILPTGYVGFFAAGYVALSSMPLYVDFRHVSTVHRA